MGWQWHQLDHIQIICTSLQTENHARTSPLSFFQAGFPSCFPISSVKALKAQHETVHKQHATLDLGSSLLLAIIDGKKTAVTWRCVLLSRGN